MRWIAGSNEPGNLPDRAPREHVDWNEATADLLIQLGNQYDTVERGGRAALDFIKARSTICEAEPEQPLSLFFHGRVYWLADLP